MLNCLRLAYYVLLQVIEAKTIQLFICTVKNGGNVLDKKREAMLAAKEGMM